MHNYTRLPLHAFSTNHSLSDRNNSTQWHTNNVGDGSRRHLGTLSYLGGIGPCPPIAEKIFLMTRSIWKGWAISPPPPIGGQNDIHFGHALLQRISKYATAWAERWSAIRNLLLSHLLWKTCTKGTSVISLRVHFLDRIISSGGVTFLTFLSLGFFFYSQRSYC